MRQGRRSTMVASVNCPEVPVRNEATVGWIWRLGTACGLFVIFCLQHRGSRSSRSRVGVQVELTLEYGVVCMYSVFCIRTRLSVRFRIPPMQYRTHPGRCSRVAGCSAAERRVQTLTDRGLNAPCTLMWRLKGAKVQIQIRARSRAPVQQPGPAMPAMPCEDCRDGLAQRRTPSSGGGMGQAAAGQCEVARAARVHGAL